MIFAGVGVALATLFDDRGEVDADATGGHAARLVDLGVQAVIVAGTTGEAGALDEPERVRLIDAVRAAVGGSVPVIAGTGAPSARQASRLTVAARDAGADAALVLSPPMVADPREYYAAVAAAVPDLPLLAYHFPAASAPGIAVGLLDELPVSGCKDSSGDAERLLATMCSTRLPLYTGSSALLGYAGPLGIAGAILGLANVQPEACVAAFAGDLDAQRGLVDAHLAMARRFPRALKSMMAERFATSEAARIG